jgi:L-iditol 2-dehydrogenase
MPPMPTIGDTEVLVRTRTVGICHSDYELAGRPLHHPDLLSGHTPGHEWCGEIVEVGKAVKTFKVGDRVVGECVVRTPERLHHFGFSMDGADRQYFNVNPDWLHKLPDSGRRQCAAR